MAKVHVVMGVYGEYSDRCEYPMIAMASERAAQAHVRKADRVRTTVLALAPRVTEPKGFRHTERLDEYCPCVFNPYDPHAMSLADAERTRYFVMDVPLGRTVKGKPSLRG